MLFCKYKSTLEKHLSNYNSLFEMWKKESFNDGSVDEISFENGINRVVFQEDLREHIINLIIINSQKRIGKVYYRTVMLDKELEGVEELKTRLSLLKKNNLEKEEIEIYIEFLKLNKIL